MGERTLAGTARQASGPGQKSGQPRPIYSAQFAGTSWTWASLPPPLVAAGSWSMLASMEGTAAETPRRAVGPKQSSSPWLRAVLAMFLCSSRNATPPWVHASSRLFVCGGVHATCHRSCFRAGLRSSGVWADGAIRSQGSAGPAYKQ